MRNTTTITVDIDTDLYAALEELADSDGEYVETVIENALRDAVAEARPFTVTEADLSDRVRDIMSRHRTLGGATEALAVCLREDHDRQQFRGLPSKEPRIEHNGTPIEH